VQGVQGGGIEVRRRSTSREQDAVRLLLLLSAAGDAAVPKALGTPEGATHLIRGQMKLQALDFWLRYPDYLANELLGEYEAGRWAEALGIAQRIMDNDEPRLRRWPMLRWLNGAYEPLDNALAILRACGLLAIHRVGEITVARHDYYLLEGAFEQIDLLLQQAPGLQWYADRARLVAELAAGTPRSRSTAAEMEAAMSDFFLEMFSLTPQAYWDKGQEAARAMGWGTYSGALFIPEDEPKAGAPVVLVGDVTG